MEQISDRKEARREMNGLTSGVERKLLARLARLMPDWVLPDHLTGLGLAALAAGGLGYALAGQDLRWLHFVNLCLLLNWFGDSLDGTLPRRREKTRPRYGFYVDHMVDAFGALFLLAGLAVSGLMNPTIALGVLTAFFLLSIDTHLAAYSLRVFELSHGRFGGTELRILLALVNLSLMRSPVLSAFGHSLGFLDLAGGFAIISLLIVTIISATRNTIELYRAERV